jgi:thiosulfate/3-mercaptopyruvate sulfurtransferase
VPHRVSIKGTHPFSQNSLSQSCIIISLRGHSGGRKIKVAMYQSRFAFLLLISFLLVPLSLFSREIPPIVSSEWLEQNRDNPKVIIVDIRDSENYRKGHIPGAVNTPYSLWAVVNNGLLLELPSDEALRDLLGKSGIKSDSAVVVVNKFDSDFSRADATRVAWTCIVAGVKNAAVLDGGYERWMSGNKPVTTNQINPEMGEYSEPINRSLVALKSYVLGNIGKSVLVDNRTPEDYFGITSGPGHIKSAVNLPTPWAFTSDGRFRNKEDLERMANGVVGEDKSKEIIAYCGVGGYASTWWFLLTQLLGYHNVKLYDGSIQEWLEDPSAPVTAYRWK